MTKEIQRFAGYPVVRPVGSKLDWERLSAEAAKDHHHVFYPSHLIEKNGEIAGYLGVCSMPVLRLWLHTERMKARDTAMVLSVAENLMRANGVEAAAGLIAKQSVAFPLVQRFGWTAVGETMLCVKDLRK